MNKLPQYTVLSGEYDNLPLNVRIDSGPFEAVEIAYTKFHFSDDPSNPYVKFEYAVNDIGGLEWTDDLIQSIDPVLCDILMHELELLFE